jgi:hypothetical protein
MAIVWKEVIIKECLLDIVAHLSSRIYLGDELGPDEQWLKISKLYTSHFFTAATKLCMYPRLVRWLVHWVIPECKLLRIHFRNAQDILQPIVDRRRGLRAAAIATVKAAPDFRDALDWVEREAAAKGVQCNPAIFQLLLTTVSINTTTDLPQQCIVCISQNPSIIGALREEIRNVLRTQDFFRASLSDIKLLDSVIKESQRLKPTSIGELGQPAQK